MYYGFNLPQNHKNVWVAGTNSISSADNVNLAIGGPKFISFNLPQNHKNVWVAGTNSISSADNVNIAISDRNVLKFNLRVCVHLQCLVMM